MIWKKHTKLLGFFLLIGSMKCLVHAQEPLNTQILYSNISRNPALTGLQLTDLHINLAYQPQNSYYLVPYKTLQFQIESQYRNKENLDGFTVGALIKYDEAGANLLKRAQFLPVLNFHKSLSEVKTCYLNLAFMSGIYKTQFDLLSLPNTTQFNPIPFDPAHPVPPIITQNSSTYFDFSTGFSLYEEINNQISVYMGAALFHFGQNTIKQNRSISKMQEEWVLNSGFFLKGEKISMDLFGDLRINQSEIVSYSACILGLPVYTNLLNQRTEIKMGAYYNSTQVLSPVIALKFPNSSISLSYSYFTGSRKTIPFLKNGIECNTSFDFDCHKRTKESEKMKCANKW